MYRLTDTKLSLNYAFVGFKSVAPELLQTLERSTDLPGCHVLINETKPVYVGISRKKYQAAIHIE